MPNDDERGQLFCIAADSADDAERLVRERFRFTPQELVQISTPIPVENGHWLLSARWPGI